MAPPVTTMVAYLVMPVFGWRAMFMIAGIAALIIWVARHGLAESPRWYAARGDQKKANEILDKIEQEIEEEKGIKLSAVTSNVETDDVATSKIPFSSLFKGHLLKTTILAISVLIAMNTAIYSIMNWILRIPRHLDSDSIGNWTGVPRATGQMSRSERVLNCA